MAEPNLYSEPAGYFITLSAYGNRLHGDVRGTVDWRTNSFGEPPLAPDSSRLASERSLMAAPPLAFDEPIRRRLELAVAEVCAFRGWNLHACHCRTNHLHFVLTADASVAKVLHDVKSIATRRLRASRLVGARQPVWAEHGSTIYLWNEDDVLAASEYVVSGQGTDLPGSLRPGPWLNGFRPENPS